MPLFSIVTVTLNPTPGDLQRTVESVLAQHFCEWELVIKDGGSTRGPDISGLKDHRIRVVTRPDTGIFDAMNQGLQEVTGEFVCFLNAGDAFFDATVLETVVKEHQGEPGVEFFYGNVAKPMSRSGFEYYPATLSRRFLFSRMICHQAWFVRRSVYDRLGGYETDLPSGGDPRYLLRMVLKHEVRHRGIGRPVVTYLGGGLSQLPDNLERSQNWVSELKAELFTPGERIVYRLDRLIQLAFKRLLYYPFAWRLLRFVRSRKHRLGRSER